MIVGPTGLNRTIVKRNIISILVDNSIIELPELNLKILGKATTLVSSMRIPKQGKTNMNHNALQAGT